MTDGPEVDIWKKPSTKYTIYFLFHYDIYSILSRCSSTCNRYIFIMTGYIVTAVLKMPSLILSFLDMVLDSAILTVCCLIHLIPLTLWLGACYYIRRYGILKDWGLLDNFVFYTLVFYEDWAVTLCYWAVWWYIGFFVTIVGRRFFVEKQSIVTALVTTLNDEIDWHLFPYLVAVSYPFIWIRPLYVVGRKVVESWPWIWYFSKVYFFFLSVCYPFYVWKFRAREGQSYKRAFVNAFSNGLLNDFFDFLIVLSNMFVGFHPTITRLVARQRARVRRWQHYFNGRVPGPFVALPTEIKLQIAAMAIDLNDETEVLSNLLFNTLPALHHREPYMRWYAVGPIGSLLEHFGAQLQAHVFAPTIDTLVGIKFKTLHTLVSKQYARSQLFPNGVTPQDRYNAGDTHAQWTAFSLETNTRDPNLYSSYYYFWYLNFFQTRAYTVLDALHALTGHAPTTQRFKTITQLFIFLGNRPNNGINNAQRYSCLSTLTRAEISHIDSLLAEIALAIATRYRDHPPPESSAYSKLYHNGANLTTTIHDCIQMLPSTLSWHTFTHSGAYETCIKSWLLGLSSLSFYHFFVLDEPRRTGSPLPFWSPVWKKEWVKRRTQLFVAVRIDPLGAGNDEIEFRPGWNGNLIPDSSMEQFAMVNPLWMWMEVMRRVDVGGVEGEEERGGGGGREGGDGGGGEKTGGSNDRAVVQNRGFEEIEIEGRNHEDGVGVRVAWYVPVKRNLHPEWESLDRQGQRQRRGYSPPVGLARWAGSVVDL